MHRDIRVSNYILAAFSALSLTMLSLPLSAPVRAFKACALYLSDPLAFYGIRGAQRMADIPAGTARLLSADMANVRLEAQLRDAAWLKTELEVLRTENRRLTQALSLRAAPGYAPIWAGVMERDPLHWYDNIMVDAGSERGVRLNAPVFGDRDGALVAVGRVTEVRRDSAIVMLLTDELSSLAAYLSTAAVDGLVQGQGGPRLRMNYLHSEAVLAAGDLVYTSPTSATFPGDILVGRIAALNPRDPFLTFQSAEVDLAVDAAKLSHVMILRPRTPGEALEAASAKTEASAAPPVKADKPGPPEKADKSGPLAKADKPGPPAKADKPGPPAEAAP
ncbi:MAG: rod shape-determining protein MreC [Elusimicrobia bacterium]|nr:rod shape-determining protein MreC [Elusimicrobiota bacterium]